MKYITIIIGIILTAMSCTPMMNHKDYYLVVREVKNDTILCTNTKGDSLTIFNDKHFQDIYEGTILRMVSLTHVYDYDNTNINYDLKID